MGIPVRPIKFSTTAYLPVSPNEIAERILDVSNWTDFRGYGPLPGIRSAEFALRTPEVVGSRIQVCNTDGSSHFEEIVDWQPERRIQLNMSAFSAPLSWLAKSFDETWEFERDGEKTTVVRSFELHAQSALTRPILWLISLLLRKAIDQQLRQIRDGG